MNGARLVHDKLCGHGGEVPVADPQKGLAPLAGKTNEIGPRRCST